MMIIICLVYHHLDAFQLRFLQAIYQYITVLKTLIYYSRIVIYAEEDIPMNLYSRIAIYAKDDIILMNLKTILIGEHEFIKFLLLSKAY